MVSGTVVYPETKGPAENARIVFWPVDWTRPINGRLPSAVTGPDGQFSISLFAGRWLACADKLEENYYPPNFLHAGRKIDGKCVEFTVSSAQPRTIDLILGKPVTRKRAGK